MAFITRVVAGVAAAVVAAAVGIVAPEVTYAAAPVAIIAAIVTVVWLVLPARRTYRYSRAALALAGVACIAVILPDIRTSLSLATARPIPAGVRTVSLVELNAWDLNPDPARTIAWLRQANVDIIILAEARETFIADLIRAFPDYPTAVTCSARPYCGTVILSRFKGRVLPGGRNIADGLALEDIPPTSAALAAAELAVPRDDGGEALIPVVGVHLDRRAPSSITRAQIDSLLAEIDRAAGANAANLILAGDFNASPWSPQLRRLDARLAQSIRARRVSAFLPTWPSATFAGLEIPRIVAIDQVYRGCALAALRMRVGPDVGSDHRPLMGVLFPDPASTSRCAEIVKRQEGR